MENSKYIIPHVNTETGQIFGCEEGSLKWFHEKGHIEFGKSAFGSSILMIRQYLQQIFLFSLMLSIPFRILYFIPVTSWGLDTMLFLFEEWWANQYASENFEHSYKVG